MIEARDVVVRYGDAVAVDGVSLTVRDGEFVLLVGANGSGKTSLVRTFNALREPDAGTVLVDGTDVTDAPVAARTSVGMVFQHPRDGFVASTVGADVAFGPENLGLPREAVDRRVADALAAVNLDGRREDSIASLSGGEEARVAVAGALAMEPDHLVLDEPLAGLDAATRRSVVDHLRVLSGDGAATGTPVGPEGEIGVGVVAVSHDVRDLVDVADRVIGLVDGTVALDAPPEEALDRLADVGVRDPRC